MEEEPYVGRDVILVFLLFLIMDIVLLQNYEKRYVILIFLYFYLEI